MPEAYYDTPYLFKLLAPEFGSDNVRARAMTLDAIACSIHARAEFAAICHRKFREGAASREQASALIEQLRAYAAAGGIHWLPIDNDTLDRAEEVIRCAPANSPVRPADALHLASAAENNFTEIHSSDPRLLAAAPLFGLRAIDLIGRATLRVVV